MKVANESLRCGPLFGVVCSLIRRVGDYVTDVKFRRV